MVLMLMACVNRALSMAWCRHPTAEFEEKVDVVSHWFDWQSDWHRWPRHGSADQPLSPGTKEMIPQRASLDTDYARTFKLTQFRKSVCYSV